jgi:hypothetical protein
VKILLALSVLLLSACGTLFSGTSDNVAFNSTPSGAKIEINGVSVGRTPTVVNLHRQMSPPQIMVKLDGYETKSLAVQNSFNMTTLWDIFLFPTFIVDLATGALMKFDPLNYNIELDAKPNTVITPPLVK